MKFLSLLLFLPLSVQAQVLPASDWGLKEIDSARAWKITRGDRRITVAVIDTGADVTHPDLKANIWMNKGECGRDRLGRNKSTNGVDDDGNGFIDDFQGWNFSSNNNDISDHHGHGTHIAGIIGANGSLKGVAPEVRLMILKYYDPHSPGENNLRATIRAIDYAVRMKADIINYSGGGLEPSADEKAALERARRAGILVVAAAGNESADSDRQAYYPADYGLSNILSVTAIDPGRRVLDSSNYGSHSVDIAAPGKSINSTLPGGAYGRMTGTSQATAFVSGVAALVMAAHPDLHRPEEVIHYLVRSGESDPALKGKTKFQVRVNSYRAVAMQGQGVNAFGRKEAPTANSPYLFSDFISSAGVAAEGFPGASP